MHRKCYKGKITSQTRRIVYDKNTKTYEYKDNHVICGIPRCKICHPEKYTNVDKTKHKKIHLDFTL